MNKKLTPTRYFQMAIVILLAACSPSGTTATPTVNVNAIPTQAATTIVAQTATIRPTATISLTDSPTPTLLPLFPLDGYVMLFTKDGDLYFQDGNDAAVKLTHVGEESYDPKLSDDAQLVSFSPIISDDNQKVIFARSDGNTYSINTDGTQEQVVISNDWLASFKIGTKIGVVNFIPGTHQLFLETHLCESQKHSLPCSNGIFLANTDTGEIRKLADFSLNHHSYGIIPRNIAVSPDGKMLAVGTLDGIQILTMNGKAIRNNILPYKPSTSDVLFPSLFWLPDSSGLIAAIPDKIHPDNFYVGGAPAYTIWRYTIGDNVTVQIPFKPPVAGSLLVSPDGSWIVYGGISPSETELYLGNLADGSAKTFGDDLMKNFSWSPDSKHFIHGNAIVISFDKSPVYGGVAPEWIDPNHYIYLVLPSNNSTVQLERVLIAEIRGDDILYYESGLLHPQFVTMKSKH